MNQKELKNKITILAIGNSFSQDATHYLHQIAAADGVDIKVVNLYIGGCSLERHWNNIQSKAAEYLLEENGYSAEKQVSIQEALGMEDWDYIVTQQVSHESGMPETYEPYLSNIVAYIREQAPKAEILLQETWAYEIDSLHQGFLYYHQNQQEMYEKVSETYRKIAKQMRIRLIPCGDVIQELRKREPFIYGHGGMSICRDGFHMNVIYGRYLLAAIWYKMLTGNSVSKNTYVPATKLAPNAVCDEKVLNVVKEIVDAMPELLVEKDGQLYVHTYSYDYVFDMNR